MSADIALLPNDRPKQIPPDTRSSQLLPLLERPPHYNNNTTHTHQPTSLIERRDTCSGRCHCQPSLPEWCFARPAFRRKTRSKIHAIWSRTDKAFGEANRHGSRKQEMWVGWDRGELLIENTDRSRPCAVHVVWGGGVLDTSDWLNCRAKRVGSVASVVSWGARQDALRNVTVVVDLILKPSRFFSPLGSMGWNGGQSESFAFPVFRLWLRYRSGG